ncbi:MAG: choice-of-anchor Q domain-containing protein [Microcoleus sp.]
MATITNSTFSANTAANFGAIRNGGTLNLSSSTLTLNTATNQGGGIFNTNVANVRNTIIAGNTAPLNPDVDGTFTSQGNNLIGNSGAGTGFTNGVNGDQVGTAGTPINPNLGALANNGDPTQTHAPNLGSPAIDRGNSAIALTTDQRNLTRVSGSNVDIGAVELQQTVSITALDNSASETPIDAGTFRISRSASTVGNLTVNLAIDASSTAIAADYNLSSTFPVTIPNGQSFVDVILTPVDDAIPELAETLRLNLVNGNYTIAPASGNATVTITANDSINGGKDEDSLLGGAGDDWLFGDEGNDTLIGGTGSDRFILGIDNGRETILDFQSGRDAIGLIGGLSFSQLSINVENNSTLIRVTSSGQLLATLTNVSTGLINATDFAIL